MERLDWGSDDDAFVPLFGLLLIVAITVVLTAVLGAFFLDMGESVQEGPTTTQFLFDQTGYGATATVTNGRTTTWSALAIGSASPDRAMARLR